MRKGFHTGDDPGPVIDGMLNNPGLYVVVGRYHHDTQRAFESARRAIHDAACHHCGDKVVERSDSIRAWGSCLTMASSQHLRRLRGAKLRGVWLTTLLIESAGQTSLPLTTVKRDLEALMNLDPEPNQ